MTSVMMKGHNATATDIYVPTHTYKMVNKYIKNMLIEDVKKDHKFEWHMTVERDIFNLNQPIKMFGINIRHAPELSWWYPDKHFGVGIDLASRDSFVQVQRGKPTMFHKAITPYESEGFVWNEEGFGILNSCKVLLINES